MIAPPRFRPPPAVLVDAAGLRGSGRIDDAVALVETALVDARTTPLQFPFLDRVQIGLTLSDLYAATGQLERARHVLVGELAFAEQIARQIQQGGSRDEIRAATTGLGQIRDRATQLALFGQPAPELEVSDWLLGEGTTLAKQRGRVVLVDFWASWCGSCLTMFPFLSELHSRYEPHGLTIIALTHYRSAAGDVDGRSREREQALRAISDRGLQIDAGIAPDGRVQKLYGAGGLPSFALIDHAGVVRVGPRAPDKAEVERTIRQLLDIADDTAS